MELSLQGDTRTAIQGMREFQYVLELLKKVTQEIESSPTIGIFLQFPEWVQIQSCIVDALKPYPDTQRAVARALQ